MPEVLSPEEVLHLLDHVRTLKQRTILTTCYAAGLRVSEVTRLKAAAIDSQRMVIRVEQGKGQKDRYVMLSPKLLDILRGYWRTARPKEWLFPGDRPGCPITSSFVELACKLARRSAGITKLVTPHSLRHAFAVHRVVTWYQQGADVQHLLPQLATYLGHLHIAATQRYLTMTPELLREASRRFERYAREGRHE